MILGIDLGQKTTGIAISAGQLATPLTTVTHKNQKETVNSIVRIIEREDIDTVIIGFVEGKIKSLFTDFADELKKQKPELNIIMWDETLTTSGARDTMIKLQIPKLKRALKEHEYAAAVILQSYLDNHD